MCGGELDSPQEDAHSECMTRSSLRSDALTRLGHPTSLPVRRGARWLPLLASALTACGGGGQTGDEHSGGGDVIEELRGTAQRLVAAGALPNSASEDGWAFGWKLYAEEATPEANVFFSPYSISVASSMLSAGAGGATKAEIAVALEFSSDGDAFHQARNAVSQALEERNREGDTQSNAQSLRVSNDFWMAARLTPSDAFLNTLSAYYGAPAFLAPFETDPEAARQAINEKVAEDTEQLIDELLPPQSIDVDTVFVLTNAVYFKSHWLLEFPKERTAPAAFAAQSGASSEVSMMRNVLQTFYASSAEYEAVILPYDRLELQLVAIMPAEGTFDTFIAGLTAARVAGIVAELDEFVNLDLQFPKLQIESSVPLKPRLQALGMLQAWQRGADFSPMGAAPNVFLSNAFHDATISIDEEGTEAAAATAFVGIDESEPPPPIPVSFDRPFVFFIRDVETNALLFVGHYANP